MFRLAPWKVASILALVALRGAARSCRASCRADIVAAIESRPAVASCRSAPIVLGLDLQGGAHILMEVDSASVIKTQVETLRDDVRAKMREGKISISGGICDAAARRRRAHRRSRPSAPARWSCCGRSISASAAR